MRLARSAFAAALLAACAGIAAENLVSKGDFSASAEDLSPECRADSGRVSLHLEDRTWNRCGKCEVTGGTPDHDCAGHTVHAASALIGFGSDGKGFAITPGTRYDVSFDVRCVAPTPSAVAQKRDHPVAMGIATDAVCWTGDNYWQDRKTVKGVIPGGVKATSEWKTFKGSFRTPEGAKRAALRLSIWSSSKLKESRQFAPGDAFLFDNVRVSESPRNLGAADDAPPAVTLRKTVAAGDEFDDLVSFKDGRTPASARARFRVWKESDALCFDVIAEEPGGVALGTPDRVWSGDTIEIQVEGRDGARTRTHVAFNNAGAKYTDAGPGASGDDWAVEVDAGASNWTARVRLPFAFLGLKGPFDELGFNVGRARAKARTFDCWSPGQSFHDPSNFGRVLFDGYAAALKREFGIDSAVATREEFESTWRECETRRLEEKLARFRESGLSVAPVSTLSDWSVPFLPEEIFDPPTNISLKAAVNEIVALPLAIANLAGRAEDFRVALEADCEAYAGLRPGLDGFPAERIVARRAVRIRDVASESPSMRLDPLVKMDEAGIVSIPPREAGLVWYDFDCTGVKPGFYKGRLRVIPLCEQGGFSGSGKDLRYKGRAQTIPVTLEVVDAEIPKRAPAPAQYFLPAPSQEVFDMAFQIGAEAFQIHSWAFRFERNEAGDLDLDRPSESAKGVSATVANHREWAARHGFSPKFVIVYSAMEACAGLYGCANKPEAFRRIWPQYVRGVKKVMNEAGVSDEDYVVEVKDEPRPETLAQLLEAHRLAKEACPSVRLMMLLAAWKPSVEQLRDFIPYSDEWVLWRGGYFGTDAWRAFVRELQAAGKRVSMYSCEVSIRMPLLQYYRQHAWFAERHGLDGLALYQMFENIHSGKFGAKDFMSTPGAGIIYGSFGVPLPSLRFMALREGFSDCRMLAALKAANEKVGNPEVAEFLKSAATEVMDRHPNDASLPDKMRNKARDLLADLSRLR